MNAPEETQPKSADVASIRTRGSRLVALVGAGALAWALLLFAKDLSGQAPSAPERSKVPTVKEWETAPHVKLTRASGPGKECEALRVREWLRIKCFQPTFALSLLGGSNEGLSFWIGAGADGAPGEVLFPARVGDARVIQFWKAPSAPGGAPEPLLLLQEHWVAGAEEPTITLL